jgi:branched-chain amino acid aminotransferase
MIVWCNGELVDAHAVRISPFDHGLLTGDGVFETLATVGRVPFGWTRHLRRLRTSAHGLGLRGLPHDEALWSAARAVIDANATPDDPAGELRVRITVTGGDAPPGSGRGDGRPLVLITASPLPEGAPTVDVVVAPWSRNERGATAGLKTTSYAENVMALAWAQERGAGEALLANTRGELCEGTGTNVFVVLPRSDDPNDPDDPAEVVTPPLSSGCLAGVTRGLVIELGGIGGTDGGTGGEWIEVVERNVPIGALAWASEAFLTSTTRAVQPVRSIDGRLLRGCPGPATSALARAFADLVARDLDP